MAVLLPDTSPMEVTPRLIPARAEQEPAFGNGAIRLNRMGARYAFDVMLPPLYAEDASDWSDLELEAETLLWPVWQPLDTGAPGAPKVNGSGQSGSSLILKGLTAYYPIRRDQWLTVITGGRHYLYRAKSEAVAASNGTVTVPLKTMLRQPHSNNDVVLIAQPLIEGWGKIPDDCFAVDRHGHVNIRFTIAER